MGNKTANQLLQSGYCEWNPLYTDLLYVLTITGHH